MVDHPRSELSSSYLTACATPTTRLTEASDRIQFAEEQPVCDNDEQYESGISVLLDFEDTSIKAEDELAPNEPVVSSDGDVKAEDELNVPPDAGQIDEVTRGISSMLSPVTASSTIKLKEEEKQVMQTDGFGTDFMSSTSLNAKEEEHVKALNSNPNVTGRTPRLPLGRNKNDNGLTESQEHVPRILSGPALRNQRRASSHRSSIAHSLTNGHSHEEDPVAYYKPGATIPKAPKLHTERRISQTAALRRVEENARAVELGKDAAVIARRRTSRADIGMTKPRRTSLLALSRVDSHPRNATRCSRISNVSKASGRDELVQSYQLVPTKPTSPHFHTEARIAAHRASGAGRVLKPANGAFRRAAEKLCTDNDLAKSYKLEPTKSMAPRFRTQERIMAKNLLQSTITSKKEEAVDLAANYQLKPTLPTSPNLCTEQRLRSHPKTSSSVRNAAKNEAEADAALLYKMEPTIPKSPRLSHLPTIASSAKQQIVSAPVEIDYALTYKLERTIPKSYRLSTAQPRTTASNPTDSPNEPVKQHPFRALPMPDFSESTVKPLQRPHSMKTIGKQTAKVDHKPHKVEPPLTRTVPMKHQLESEKRHEEYVARMNMRRSISQGSVQQSITQPAEIRPFQLQSVARHEAAVEAWNRRLEAEREEQERRRNFKASPLWADMLDGATFVPELGLSKLTSPEDVVTASRERATLRAEYDERNAIRVAACERQKEEARAIREKEEYERYSRRPLFRARPVPASLYRAPDVVRTPRTSKNKSDESTKNNELNGADASGTDASGGYSPKELIAGVRRALGRLGSPV